MSIYPLARVWDFSQHRGNHLLLLVAMADVADELGVLWAGSDFLAGRIRTKDERQVRRMLRYLEDSGEIITIRSQRPDGLHLPNYYIITTGATANILADAHARVGQMIAARGGGKVARGGKVAPTPKATKTTGGGGKNRKIVGAGMPPPVGASQPPDPIDPEEGDQESIADRNFWNAALGELEVQMTRATFDKWLRGSTAKLRGDELTIFVASIYAVDWLATRLHDLVRRTADNLAGRPLIIRYEVEVGA